MTNVLSIVMWLVAAMTAWVPPSQHIANHETTEAAALRYEQIATDAVSVAYDPSEKPIFSGDHGRAKTALLMLAIARYESTYVKRIDEGNCKEGECDHGMAACLMQVHAERGGIVLEGDTYKFADDKGQAWKLAHADEILTLDRIKTDRKACFRAALHKMRESMMSCSALPKEDRLGIYTGEGCKKDVANPKSRTRMKAAEWYVGKGLPSIKDDDVLTGKVALNP